MRLAGNAQPYGARLRTPTRIKIKGLQVVPKASDIAAATDGAGWGKMWSNFDWSGWIKPQIDLALANGANCVKVTGSGATADYPASATFLARVAQFLDYCVAQGLRVYWSFASTDWGGSVAAATAPLQAIAAKVASYPQVIGLDVVNEIGVFGVSLASAQQLLPIAKTAAPNLPCTGSLSCSSAAAFTNSTASGIAPYVDFMDFHPYFDTGDPANSDWATYRAQSYYKPWVIGECGKGVDAGSTAQTSRWTALGVISTSAADCFGAVGFSITDYESAHQFGMYPATLTGARSQVSTPFAAWPAR